MSFEMYIRMFILSLFNYLLILSFFFFVVFYLPSGLSVTVNETNENSTDIMVVFSSVELSVQIEVTPDVLNILLMMGSKTLHSKEFSSLNSGQIFQVKKLKK